MSASSSVQQATVAFKQLCVSSDEQLQRLGGSCRDSAAGRCVEHADPSGKGSVGKYPPGGRGGAGHIDPGGRPGQRREHSARHEHHVVQFPGAEKHGDQDVRRHRHLSSRAAPARAGLAFDVAKDADLSGVPAGDQAPANSEAARTQNAVREAGEGVGLTVPADPGRNARKARDREPRVR